MHAYLDEPGEFQITTNPFDQSHPALYNNIVVFQDNRNGNWDIYGYDLVTGKEFPICTDPYDQQNPAIYETIVVWDEFRHGADDRIYGYNLSTHEKFLIVKGPGWKIDPEIYGEIVVWTDYRNDNGDIYGYNISTYKEFPITTHPDEQYGASIYKDIVVWEDERVLLSAVYGYNLETHEEFQIFAGSEWNKEPVVCGDIVVWRKNTYDYHIIEGYTLSEQKDFRVYRDFWLSCKQDKGVENLALHDDVIVWVDCRNCNRDIYGYNLSTHDEFQIVTDENDQNNPAVNSNFVVWEDSRNGNLDIYGISLLSPLPNVVNYRSKLILMCLFYGTVMALVTVLISYRVGKGTSFTEKGDSVQTVTVSGGKREFRRNNIIRHMVIAVAISCGLLGLYITLGTSWWQIGFFLLAYPGVLIYHGFRYKKLPYVRVTEHDVIIYPKTIIPRDVVHEVNILKDKIELMLSTGKKVKISMFQVEKSDREDLIQTFEKSF